MRNDTPSIFKPFFMRFNGFLDKNGSLIPHWLFSWLKTPENALKRGLKRGVIYTKKSIPNNIQITSIISNIAIKEMPPAPIVISRGLSVSLYFVPIPSKRKPNIIKITNTQTNNTIVVKSKIIISFIF